MPDRSGLTVHEQEEVFYGELVLGANGMESRSTRSSANRRWTRKFGVLKVGANLGLAILLYRESLGQAAEDI